MADLVVQVEQGPAGTTLRLRGDVDVATVAEARTAFEQATTANPGDVFVDLTDVSFVDSTGLGMFIGWHKSTMAAGRHLRLDCVPSRVSRMLRLTGLDRILDVQAADQ